MKIKLNIKNVLTLSILAIMITSISLFFINTSFAANTATVTVETANLRETASSTSKILELINKGENVEVVEKEEDWYKVKYKGIVGYLRNDLVSVSNEETTSNNDNSTLANTTNTENTSNTANAQNEIKENVNEANEISNEVIQNTAVETNTEGTELTTEVQDVKGKYKVKEDTTLKVIPLIHALDLENISKDTEVEVTDVMNYWAYAIVENKQGWVVLEKIERVDESAKITEAEQTTDTQESQENTNTTESNTTQTQNTEAQTSKTMYANSQTVNVRSNADRNSSLVTQIAINTQVEVVAEENGWSKVNVNGKQGYILSSLLSTKKQDTTRSLEESRTASTTSNATTSNSTTSSTSSTTSSSSTSSNGTTSSNDNASSGTATSTTGDSVVAYAKQFIGVQYTYGGTSPSTGFDCSGFTSYVYKHFGISLPRTSGGQSGVGTAVSRANLVPGDLVIYSGHVAIYVGGGNVIHAPRPGKTVCIVPLDQAGYGFSGGRRVL